MDQLQRKEFLQEKQHRDKQHIYISHQNEHGTRTGAPLSKSDDFARDPLQKHNFESNISGFSGPRPSPVQM